MAQLRGAVIGYGLAGSVFHAPLIASTPGLTVSAVVTGNPQRQAEASAGVSGFQGGLRSGRGLRERRGARLRGGGGAQRRPRRPARRALDAGLPVVVDKPLAPTAAEARSLVEQAERLGVLLTVFMNRRWDSDQLTLRRLLDERKLGEVLRYESRFERWRPALSERKPWREVSSPEAGGGVLLDLGSHLVDQALVLFGASRPGLCGGGKPPRRRGRRRLPGPRAPLRSAESPLGFAAGGGPGTSPARARRSRGIRRHRGRRAGGCAPLGRPAERRRGVGCRTARPVGPCWSQRRQSEAIASERGDWPRFYIELERALAGRLAGPGRSVGCGDGARGP